MFLIRFFFTFSSDSEEKQGLMVQTTVDKHSRRGKGTYHSTVFLYADISFDAAGRTL